VEDHRYFIGKSQDGYLPLVKGWIKAHAKSKDFTEKRNHAFVRFVLAKNFFVDKEDRLYTHTINSHWRWPSWHRECTDTNEMVVWTEDVQTRCNMNIYVCNNP